VLLNTDKQVDQSPWNYRDFEGIGEIWSGNFTSRAVL